MTKQKEIVMLTNQPFDVLPCKKDDTVQIVPGVLRVTETVGRVEDTGRYYSGDVWIAVRLGRGLFRMYSDEIAGVIG